MNLKKESTTKYVENYLNSIFVEDIEIDIQNDHYLINKTLKIPIYSFWKKNDQQLLENFKDFAFENDTVGTMFFFLSGYWEYTHKDIKDTYGRFPALESFQYHGLEIF